MSDPARPRRSIGVTAATALAALVHLSTAAIGAAGLAVVVLGWPTPVSVAIGVLLVLLAWVLRPRLARAPDGVVLRRGSAPALFGVLDRLGEAMGSPPLEVVVVTEEFNAATVNVGLRQTPVLVFGAPLWNLLESDERLAVLAHELAHQVNGDGRRRLVLGSALTTLGAWYRLLAPGPEPGAPTAGALVLFHVFYLLVIRWPLRQLVRLVLAAELRLSRPEHQQAEYFADHLAARCVGTEPSVKALGTTLIIPVLADRLVDDLIWMTTDDIWAQQRLHLARLSETEREEARRQDQKTADDVYRSHPATYRRIAHLRARHTEPGTVTPATAGIADAEAELAPLLDALARRRRKRLLRAMPPGHLDALGLNLRTGPRSSGPPRRRRA